ncbi:hypothetical protein BN7_4336 [Wickerhamomyces ciferrii]|uniref:Uncharacterized protein n=1 Tax=Wickerhamomyces ciferrii (strain ATCC 14091 / BCRC 22168 / CBS 111 / JCM 3599 / NBRC 0793 / NRRL Y-1031 F-60-10) TaxID=1206466 RepID=K0KUA5_WICCF|nr:uncharacterized protein BN7_4336 [Wickerhamomyces ciferrii]CCH44768.1 hypothetical protein BN7_4336 [Wickerhamomyces ciferrii]
MALIEEDIPQFGELIVLDRFNEFGEVDTGIEDSFPIIKNQKTSIGRNVGNTITINHPAISGTHCVIWSIQFDDNSIPLIYLKDVSLNGTYINDVKIAKNSTVLLNHLDTIAIEYGIELEYQSIFGNQEAEYGDAIMNESSIVKELPGWSITKGNSLCSIPEFEALVIVYQITNALRYLHQNGIVHRDLKLDNILLATPEPFTKVVLADFGIAKSICSTKRRMFTVVGTPEYCAPEVGFDLKKNPDFKKGILTKSSLVKRGYDSKCDIWSLGIISHIMLSGISPFYEDGNELNIIKSAKKGQLNFKLRQWSKVSLLAKDFVSSLLRVNIDKRLDILECYNHDWIQIHNGELQRIYKKILTNFT